MKSAELIRVKWIALIALFVLAGLLFVAIFIVLTNQKPKAVVVNYADCTKAKDAKLLETYPEQCVVGGKTYVNPTQKVKSLPGTDNSQDIALLQAYNAKNGDCKAANSITTSVKRVTINGWAEVNAGCEQGSGGTEVWHKVNDVWTYVVGFQDGPYCTMVVDNNISKELYATCITTETSPNSVNDANGRPTITNQIP